ncbi:type III secretion system protein PrgF [Enterococcus hirae]
MKIGKKFRKEEILMDIITKIITTIGGIIGVLAAISVLVGIKNIRSGMSNDDSRTLDKGIEQVIVGGVMALVVTGVVTYVITQVGNIQF